ncbi:hypothetical protein BKA62DRAFT_714493 [Auriculariales sp. MPI-PUGE-AT-0066]|nr:hypothetical protein BKA62DRAFT_714493 [Auriculariales sp. MPI-PUGE-AT-0066]
MARFQTFFWTLHHSLVTCSIPTIPSVHTSPTRANDPSLLLLFNLNTSSNDQRDRSELGRAMHFKDLQRHRWPRLPPGRTHVRTQTTRWRRPRCGAGTITL